MSTTRSPSTEKAYGVALVCRVWEIPRSSFYERKSRRLRPLKCAIKPGPKTEHSDAELVDIIRALLAEVEADIGWRGEGYRKVHARLRHRGLHVGRKRVLRVMREHGLLAPTRTSSHPGPRTHNGTITSELPNVMWGTDGTTTLTRHEGSAWVFIAVDHCSGDCVGIHAAKVGDRFEALQPVLQGVGEYLGPIETGVAVGLALRHDNGSQYVSRDFQREITWLGIESSPSFVASPEGNGIAERFIRTLKEQLLWVRTFNTVEDLRLALQEFRRRYNDTWILARNGYLSPSERRRQLTQIRAA